MDCHQDIKVFLFTAVYNARSRISFLANISSQNMKLQRTYKQGGIVYFIGFKVRSLKSSQAFLVYFFFPYCEY